MTFEGLKRKRRTKRSKRSSVINCVLKSRKTKEGGPSGRPLLSVRLEIISSPEDEPEDKAEDKADGYL